MADGGDFEGFYVTLALAAWLSTAAATESSMSLPLSPLPKKLTRGSVKGSTPGASACRYLEEWWGTAARRRAQSLNEKGCGVPQ
jgi:hypothetical protein